MPRNSISRLHSERGIALVLTLAILVLVTLLLIGFAVSMRVENTASKNFNDVIRARQLAQAAVDEAVAKLNQAIPADPTAVFVTQPGLVITPSGRFPIFSTINAQTTDLNMDKCISATASHTLMVGWTTNSAGPDNKLIGRYAYWADDEAAKININATHIRQNRYGNSPLDIDLRILWNVANVHADRTYTYAQNPGFTTLPEWIAVSGIGPVTYESNKFWITAFSTETNMTPWGTDRINLNTLAASVADVQRVATKLSEGNLTNWFGQTFAQKYYTAGELNQIAANIIDYHTAGDNATTDNAASPSYCGLKPVPYLNAIVVNAQIKTNAPALAKITTQFELINPYSVAKGAGYNIVVDYQIVDSGAGPGLPAPLAGTITVPVGANVPAYGYALSQVGTIYNQTTLPKFTGPRSLKVNFTRLRLLNAGGALVDYAQALSIPPTWAAPATFPVQINGPQVSSGISDNDPRAHRTMTMVNPLTGATVRLWDTDAGAAGGKFVHTLYNAQQPSAAQPGTDLTDDGRENAQSQARYSNYHVASANYNSVAELGFIHTGIPWRSLRLQPRAAGTHIPDWAALDLFRTTDQNPVAGRINLNAYVTNLTPIANMRLGPLMAVLTNTAFGATAATVANRIYNRAAADWVTSPAKYTPPSSWGVMDNSFPFTGRICELVNVADSTAGTTDSNREERVRAIANLITTRGTTFSVWAIGQTIQGAGAITNVTAEAKVQAVVVRTWEGGQAKFRTKYYRYINN